MSSEKLDLKVTQSIKLPRPLTPGASVTFYSERLDISSSPDTTLEIFPGGKIDQVWITLLNNIHDIILRIHFRPQQNVVLLNSKLKDGHWQIEQRFADLRRAFGPDISRAKIVVRNVGKEFLVYINGNFLRSYGKFVGGDAEFVDYGIDDGSTALFADTFKVSME